MAGIFIEIVGNASQFKRELDKAVASTAKANSGFAKMSKAAGIAGLALAGGLAIGLAKSIEAASRFESEMELIQTQAGGTAEEVHNMSKALVGLAASVGNTPEELAKGLFHVESAGFRGAKALSILKLAAEGAAVGHSDLEATTTALVAAQRSGIKGLGDMSHAMGSLNAIVGAGNMRMEDLTSALATGVLPAAKAFGLSISDVGAALATMTSNGIPAQNAAAALRMMFISLAAPTEKAKGLLKDIGLGAEDLANTIRRKGLVAALTELKTHMEAAGLTATQQGALLASAFGRRSSTGLLTLIGNLKDMGRAQQQIKTGSDEFGKAWAETQKTSEFQTKQFHASVAALEVGIGAGLLPAVNKTVQAFTQFTVFLSQHQELTKALVIGLAALSAALIVTSVAAFIAANALTFGLVAAVAAVAVGVALLIKHFDSVISWLKAHWPLIAGILLGPFPFIVAEIIKHWAQIKTTFSDALTAIVSAVRAGFAAVVGAITGALGAALSAAAAVGRAIVNGLKQGLATLVSAVTGAFGKLWGEIRGLAGAAEAAATAIGSAIVRGVLNGLSGLASSVTSKIRGAVSAALHAVTAHIPGFSPLTAAAAESISLPIIRGAIKGLDPLGAGLGGRMVTSIAKALGLATGFVRRVGLPNMADLGETLAEGLHGGFEDEQGLTEKLGSAKQNVDEWADSTGVDNLFGVGKKLAGALASGFSMQPLGGGAASIAGAAAAISTGITPTGGIVPSPAGSPDMLGGDIIIHNVMELDGQVAYESWKRQAARDVVRNGGTGVRS